MTLIEQIRKIKARLEDKPDPLMVETLKSLQKLERLQTVAGLIEFHQREYCSTADAAEIAGCKPSTMRKNIMNYHKPPGRPQRVDVPSIIISDGKTQRYIVVKRGLKPLKHLYQSE